MLLDDLKRVRRILFITLRIDLIYTLFLVLILFSIGISPYKISIPYNDLLIGLGIGSSLALITIIIGKYTRLFTKEKHYKIFILIIITVLLLFLPGENEELVFPMGMLFGYANSLVVGFLVLLLLGFNWSNQ